jgi:hypothetical protein
MMRRNLMDTEERFAQAEALHRELAEGLRGLGVEAGDRPLRLSVAELARLLGNRGYGLVLEARDGEGRPRLRFELSPEDPTLECMVGRGEWGGEWE